MAEAKEKIRSYRFGDFIVDERRGALQRQGADVPLRPKTWGVLHQLMLHRGELVTKQALLDAVWCDRIVSEGVVAKSVREIRQALGDENRAVIRTVSGRGYIFDVPVTVETTAGGDPAHRWRSGALGVALLVVVAVVWNVILVAKNGERQSIDPVAYQRYLEARFLFNRRFDGDLARAEQLYLEATRIDPQFGRAWAGLAGVYWVRTDLQLDESTRLSIPEAIEAMALPIERALRADPDLAEAHIRATTYYKMKGDAPRSRDHAARALALAPTDPLVLAYTGRRVDESMSPEASASLFREMIAVDPLSLTTRINFVDWLIRQRRLEDARREIEAALSLFPEANNSFAYSAALIDLFEGDFEAAAETARALPADADHRQERMTLLVMALKAQGLAEQAAEDRLRLENASDEWAALRIAEIHAFAGAEDESFAWLREVSRRVAGDSPYRQRFWYHVNTSPFLVDLKDDPRWRRLREEYEMRTVNQRRAG